MTCFFMAIFAVLCFMIALAAFGGAVECIGALIRNYPVGWLKRVAEAVKFERELKRPLTSAKLNWRKK